MVEKRKEITLLYYVVLEVILEIYRSKECDLLAIKECKEITLLCHLHHVEVIFLPEKCKQDRDSYLAIVGIYLASYIN